MSAPQAAVTGVGLAIPGLTKAADLLNGTRTATEGGFDPETSLTGREMRHKDRATRLALRAAASALRDAGLLDADDGFGGPADETAVVVSSNLGILDSVCEYVDIIASEGVAALSPMGLPRTSSNVVAGTLAIRYGLHGPNLTLCNGATSGLDAVFWARNLISAGRARIAIVVGVEPATKVVAKLLGAEASDAAVALVLEPADEGALNQGRARALVAGYARVTDPGAAVAAAHGAAVRDGAGPVQLWLTAEQAPQPPPDHLAGVPRLDLAGRLGYCSGALGVIQCAAGVAHLDLLGPGCASVLATAGGGDRDDAAAALVLNRC